MQSLACARCRPVPGHGPHDRARGMRHPSSGPRRATLSCGQFSSGICSSSLSSAPPFRVGGRSIGKGPDKNGYACRQDSYRAATGWGEFRDRHRPAVNVGVWPVSGTFGSRARAHPQPLHSCGTTLIVEGRKRPVQMDGTTLRLAAKRPLLAPGALPADACCVRIIRHAGIAKW